MQVSSTPDDSQPGAASEPPPSLLGHTERSTSGNGVAMICGCAVAAGSDRGTSR